MMLDGISFRDTSNPSHAAHISKHLYKIPNPRRNTSHTVEFLREKVQSIERRKCSNRYHPIPVHQPYLLHPPPKNHKPFPVYPLHSTSIPLYVLAPPTSHHSARNRQTTALIPVTLNTFRLSRRTTLALDNRAYGRGGGGAGTVAVYEDVG